MFLNNTARGAAALKCFAALALFAVSWSAAAAAEPRQLTIMVFQGLQNLPILAAQEKGFFASRDLKVEVKIADNSEELRNGLAEGRHQIAHAVVDNAVAMAEAGRNVAVVLGGDNGWSSLSTQPEIGKVEDLRGKTVIVDAPNTAFALVLYKILQSAGGLQRERDYEVKVVGATRLRFEAMQTNRNYAGTILTVPFTLRAQKAGLKNLVKATDVLGPYLASAGFVMRPWAEANQDTLRRYIQAYVEGLRWVLDPSHKSEAIDLLAQRFRLSPDEAAASYAVATDPREGMARDAAIDVEGFRNALRLRAEILGQWGGNPPAVEKYLDLSYRENALAGR